MLPSALSGENNLGYATHNRQSLGSKLAPLSQGGGDGGYDGNYRDPVEEKLDTQVAPETNIFG